MKLDNAGRVTGQSISGSIWQHCFSCRYGKGSPGTSRKHRRLGATNLDSDKRCWEHWQPETSYPNGRAAVPSSGRFWRRLLVVIPFGVTVASTGLRFEAGRQEVAEEK
jgi:hypothetical protein